MAGEEEPEDNRGFSQPQFGTDSIISYNSLARGAHKAPPICKEVRIPVFPHGSKGRRPEAGNASNIWATMILGDTDLEFSQLLYELKG